MYIYIYIHIYIYIYVCLCICVYVYVYYIWDKLTHFSLLLNPAIQRMGNTPNILDPRRMGQIESHPHFIFYCKLFKVTLDYIY